MSKIATDTASFERLVARACYDRGVYHLLPGTSKIDGDNATAQFKRTICGAEQELEETVTKIFKLEDRPVEHRNFVSSPAIRKSHLNAINDHLRGKIVKTVATINRNITNDQGVTCDYFRVAQIHDSFMNRLAKWCNSVSSYVEIPYGSTVAIIPMNLHLLVDRKTNTWEHYLAYWEATIDEEYDGSIQHMATIAESGRLAAYQALDVMRKIRKLRRRLAMARTPERADEIQDELDDLLNQIR